MAFGPPPRYPTSLSNKRPILSNPLGIPCEITSSTHSASNEHTSNPTPVGRCFDEHHPRADFEMSVFEAGFNFLPPRG
jgi:hypothetical protein